jgi:predicted transposase YdaD
VLLSSTPNPRATWEEVILASLDIAARRALEEWMNLQGYPEKSTFYQRGKAEGEAKGKAEGEAKGKAEGEARALLAVLAARGLKITDDIRARIIAAADLSQIETWIVRAATAATIDDVFATTAR